MKTVNITRKSDGQKLSVPVQTYANWSKEKQDEFLIEGIIAPVNGTTEKKNLTTETLAAAPAVKSVNVEEAISEVRLDIKSALLPIAVELGMSEEEVKDQTIPEIAGDILFLVKKLKAAKANGGKKKKEDEKPADETETGTTATGTDGNEGTSTEGEGNGPGNEGDEAGKE